MTIFFMRNKLVIVFSLNFKTKFDLKMFILLNVLFIGNTIRLTQSYKFYIN